MLRSRYRRRYLGKSGITHSCFGWGQAAILVVTRTSVNWSNEENNAYNLDFGCLLCWVWRTTLRNAA